MTRSEFRLALTTTSDPAEAESLSRLLVERRLAACVNVIPAARSIYRWQGQLDVADEQLLLIKTRSDLIAGLKQAIEEAHSYECPELLVLDIADGSPAYLAWLAGSLADPPPSG